MAVSRRELLTRGALLCAAGTLPVWMGPSRGEASRRGAPLLVVVFLRGGADGLHLVPPVTDPSYERLRGSLALDTALPFAPGFGLHPALEPLQPLVERGQLAVVHACGSPDPTRSHFDAQDFMENGAPGDHTVGEGWLARALGPTRPDALFSRVALTAAAPLCLRGSGALALEDPARMSLARVPAALRDRLEQLYADGDGNDAVVGAGRRALRAAAQLRELADAPRRERAGRRGGLGARIDTLVALEEAGLDVEATFLSFDGWDTHAGQGVTQGAFARQAGELAAGLARLHEHLGARRELLTIVMTEFGRTARPNGSGGTDHGHGSVMLVAGPGVRSGVRGDWEGLESLYEGRDLPVHNDFRSVLWEALTSLRGVVPTDTFPDFEPVPLGLFPA